MRVTGLIAQDHNAVHRLFLELETAGPGRTRQELLDRIVEELEVHAQAEEDVFYTAVRQVSRRVDDAAAGHAHLRALVAQAEGLDPASTDFPLTVRQLKQAVLNHAAEEEAGMFLDAARLGLDELERLGAAMEERKNALKAAVVQRGIRAVKQAAQKVA
jgi:hemerythrin superfamily protein